MDGQAGLFAKRRNTFTLDDQPDVSAKIMAIGIGGIGRKFIDRMVEEGIQGIELVAADTDIRELRRSRAHIKLEIGMQITQGLGCCGNPQLGRKAALHEAELILDLIKGYDMVFVIGGEGGGTFTGAAPIFAALASEIGGIAIAAATMPLGVQGLNRGESARIGIQELKQAAEAVIAVSNEDLHRRLGDDVLLEDSTGFAEDVFCRAVQDLAEIVVKPGILKLELCDMQAVMQQRRVILIGTGIAEGPNRAAEAVQRAITNPMLEEMPVTEAKSVLINVTGSRQSLRLYDAKCAAGCIEELASLDDRVIGALYDDSMEDRLKVTLIASGGIEDAHEPSPLRNGASSFRSRTNWEELDRPAFRRRQAL